MREHLPYLAHADLRVVAEERAEGRGRLELAVATVHRDLRVLAQDPLGRSVRREHVRVSLVERRGVGAVGLRDR